MLTMGMKKLIVGVTVLAAPVYAAAQSTEQLIQKYTPLVVSATCAATASNAKALVEGLRDGTPFVMKMEVVVAPPPPPAPAPVFAPPPPPGATLDTNSVVGMASIDDSASAGSTGPCPTEDVTVTPRTGKMGMGNVDNALTLAQGTLKNINVLPGTASGNDQRNATPADVKAALTGGDVTTPQSTTITLPGVLELRYQGHGWGEIARQVGVRLN